ncbi:hypothetical protein MMC26_000822 [Xylographa opegraphella]|nr:hypothetical protein [Xylographa opegraphella]
MASGTQRQNYTASDVILLLPKFGDLDSDIRFMSLVDLCNILNAGPPTLLQNDYNTTAKVIDCLLKSLDDTNGDVQSQALKSIGPLGLKAPPEILCPFMEKLTNLETTKSLDSSIPATATRTLVVSFPRPVTGIEPSKPARDAYSAISKVLIPRLLGYLVIPHGIKGLPEPPRGLLEIDPEKGTNVDAVDLLYETVRCFGPMLQDVEKQALQKRLTEILDDDHTGNIVKKKVVTVISILALYFSDNLLNKFISTTTDRFQDPDSTPEKRRLLISMLGSVARSIPRRLGPYIQHLASYVLHPLSRDYPNSDFEDFDEDGAGNQAMEDVKEAALITLEDFLASCSNEMRPFTSEALDAGLRYVVYDPSTALDDEDEEMDEMQSDDGEVNDEFGLEDEDFEEDAAMSEGDDSSWKIRRCAAKVLYTLISTRGSGDLLENGTLYERVAPILIKCFKEREESVRLEILSTLAALVRKTGEAGSAMTASHDDEGYASGSQIANSRKRRRGGSDASMFDTKVPMLSRDMVSPTESPSPTSGPCADLARLSSSIVRGVVKLLKQSSIVTKQATVTLLKDFVLVQHGGLTEHLGQIIDPLMDATRSSSTSFGVHGIISSGGAASATGNPLRIEALELLRAICDTHATRYLGPYMARIVPGMLLAVNDKYPKVSGEAISVAESVVKSITPPRSSGSEGQLQIYLENIFDTVLDVVRANETDLEVRQSAIHTLGTTLARSSGSNTSKLLPAAKRSQGMDVLQERLKNETTRVSAIQAIDSIVQSSMYKEELRPTWVQGISLELAGQLRKSDRNLRASSLVALKHLTGNPAALECLDNKTTESVAELVLPVIEVDSLGLLGLAMSVTADLAKLRPREVVENDLNRALCAIVVTPLTGTTLEGFLGLVEAIGTSGAGQPLMHMLLRDVGVSGDPGIVGSAIGTLLVSGGSSVLVSITDIMKELRHAQDDQRKCLALSILGEASLRLKQSSPLQPKDFLEHFNSKSDQVPRAAAVALGRAGAGNSTVYLPIILEGMENSEDMQLLLLHSVKEILQYANKSSIDLNSYTAEIWKKLMKISESEDNKAIGAECVGRLISIEPKRYLPSLQEYLQDPAPSVRGMAIQALRFALTDADETFDEVLKPLLTQMLSTMLNDAELENRRLALITLNAATQNKANLVLPHLSQLLPLVMKESELNPTLVREVQMGPFKHKVDDGLEIRKSAYETLHALMETAFPRMSASDLFDRVVAGLQDDHEIRMLCNLMLTKLTVLDPEETLRRLDSIAERYQGILSIKLKDNAVKQDVEKAQEANVDVLRVTVRLQTAFQGSLSSTGHTSAQIWKAYREWVGKEFKTQLQAAESSVKFQR